jgi:glycosyltransferase involved in cell wall biosynthesis
VLWFFKGPALSTLDPFYFMGNTISVLISGYGDHTYWGPMADRAQRSAEFQTHLPDEIIRTHGNSLHEARNSGAEKAKSELLCFLDYDDVLEPDYISSMLVPQIAPLELRYPRVRFVNEINPDPPSLPEPTILPRRSLDRGNFMVIGTVLPRDLFLRAGGFRNIHAYEDWDLWIRCWMLGAESRLIRGAIYRATKRTGGRNQIQDPKSVCAEIMSYNKQWQIEMKRAGKC